MTSRDQGLQNWTGGTLNIIKLIGMNSSFSKICIKAQEQKWLKNWTIWRKKMHHFCSCALMPIDANLEFISINFIMFKVPLVQFWSSWAFGVAWASLGVPYTNLSLFSVDVATKAEWPLAASIENHWQCISYLAEME